MSYFSEKLKFLINESGISIYQLAKSAELDRTTIQRSISGERLPSVTFLNRLCDFLRVSPLERKDLMELYSICKIGEKTYESRKYIKNLIEQIATLHIENNWEIQSSRMINLDSKINQDVKVFSGQYNVNNLIIDILDEEIFTEASPKINLTVPFNYVFLFNHLKQHYWTNNEDIHIQHILRLSKNPNTHQNSNINLEILSNMLPFGLCVGNGYQPYYYYIIDDITKDISIEMPYFIYTSKRLVTLSADFKTAILYNNKDIKNIYINKFKECLLESTPFIKHISTCIDAVSTYINAFKNYGQITHTVEPQPCFAKYYTHKTIDDHLRPDIPDRDLVKKNLYELYDTYNNFKKVPQWKYYFSIEGLETLTSTGVIADLPTSFALPFNIEERIFLLTSLVNDIKDDTLIAHVTDASKFPISSMGTIQVHDNNVVIFVATNPNGLVSCFIEEKSICNAFLDFLESLPTSDLVYNKEETINILENFLNKLKNI